MFRILVLLSLPMICLGQGSLGRERLPVEKLNNEISPNELKRNALYNMDEIKVRWKKAALENCPGVPCVTLVAPSSPTSVVATAGDASVSVAFTVPLSNGGSVITSYTVTSSPGGITATGAGSPITVTGLTNGTTYTFTVVATNAVGNSLASAASAAVTPAAAATVPGAPSGVVATAGDASVSVAFTIPTNNGGSVITGYTVTSNPGNITATGSSSPLTVTGLTNGTSYTFTVVATNAVGSSLASAASAAVTPAAASSCSTSTITDVDGNLYHTVSIGTQCWTKENLRVTHYNDNTPIPLDANGGSGGTSTIWQNLTVGSYAIYANEASSGTNATNYGFLYNWYAAKGIDMTGSTTYKNLCPTGFHVPTDAEWTTLTDFLGGLSVAGGKMKQTGTTLWNTDPGSTNSSGFTALPGGYRNNVGSFVNIGSAAFFWSATELTGNNAWSRFLLNVDGTVYGNSNLYLNYIKSVGASVRCLED